MGNVKENAKMVRILMMPYIIGKEITNVRIVRKIALNVMDLFQINVLYVMMDL